MHPQSRVDDYVGKGYWTDETVQQIFLDRVAEFGDELAAVDPLNKADLVDLPPQRVSWNDIAAQIRAAGRRTAGQRHRRRRRARRAAAQHRRTDRRLPRRLAGTGDRLAPARPVPPPRGRRARQHRRAGRLPDQRPHRRNARSRPRSSRWSPTSRRCGPSSTTGPSEVPGAVSVADALAEVGPADAGRRGHLCRRAPGRPQRLHHDLLDVGHREPPQGRAARPLRVARDELGHRLLPQPDPRGPHPEPVPDGEHGRHQRHVPALAAGRLRARPAPPVRPRRLPAPDRARGHHLHRRPAGAAGDAAAARGAARRRRHLDPAPDRVGLGAAAGVDGARLARASTASRSSTTSGRTRASR